MGRIVEYLEYIDLDYIYYILSIVVGKYTIYYKSR